MAKRIQKEDIEKGERLLTLRKHLQLTQTQFAQKLDIVQNNVPAMEKGKRPIGQRVIKDIFTTFVVNPQWLEKGEGEMFLTGALKLMVLAESADVIEQIKSIKGVSLVSIIQ